MGRIKEEDSEKKEDLAFLCTSKFCTKLVKRIWDQDTEELPPWRF